MMPMIFQKKPEKQRKEKAKKVLSSVGLDGRMLHKPLELSGGEQQRVAIARALSNSPEVIVADEPTGNIDTKTGRMIMEILVNLHQKEQKTIVVVTHDAQIADYSEEIINIKDGRVTRSHELAQ